jgi:hypothetical protein
VRWWSSVAAVMVSMAVPLARHYIAEMEGIRRSYTYGTVVLLLSAVAITRLWPASDRDTNSRPFRWPLAWIGGGFLAFGICLHTASALLPEVFAGPLNVYKADMLPVIEAGVRTFLAGRSPYTIYEHIPWRPTLPYGPPLWFPFTLPVLARTDLRVLTLLGYLTVIGTCCFAIAYSAAARRWTASIGLAGITLFLAAHPDIHAFYPIAHSPVYWPVLLAFCALLRAERWTAAAAVLGLLVSTRTPMLSVVPVFLMAAYHQHKLTRGLLVWLAVAALGPFAPFLLHNATAVRYAMYGSYQDTVKKAVWLTGDIFETYGTTALLLGRGLSNYVELAQLVCMLVVYVAAWRALAARANPLPWLALSLLVFSLTTLWPVSYLYFDVWVILVSGLAVASVPLHTMRPKAMAYAAIAVIAIATTAVGAAAAAHPGSSYTIDVGTTAAASLTGGGFGQDLTSMEGPRSFVWIEGTTARIRLPRAGWRSATVRVELQPYEPVPGLRQRVTATLNGVGIGTTSLRSGWQEVSFPAPARLWTFGFNVLNLYFSYALPGTSATKELSAAIDRVAVD